MRSRHIAPFLVPLILVLSTAAASAAPLGTAFTYQGRLKNGGSPASGSHDLQFTLYDVAAGGSIVAGPICADNVSVAEGLFTASLDFGAVFDGNERWLQVGVRADGTPGNCGAGAYTTLSPRQLLSATPYAVRALSAPTGHALDAADGSPTDAVYVNNDGNVGIGTTTPASKLHVAGPMKINGANTLEFGAGLAKEVNAGKIGYQAFTADALDILGAGTDGNNRKIKFWTEGGAEFNGNLSVVGDIDISGARLYGVADGNIGIGTNSPLARLDIRGGADDDGGDDPKAIAFQWHGGGFRHWIRSRHFNGIANGNALDFFLNTGGQPSDSSAPGTGNVQVMTLTGNGKVGIGTSAPASNLSIVGDIDISGARLHVGTNGNVGIGTASPAQKLSVAGVIESASGGYKFPDGTTQTTAAIIGAPLWSPSGNNISNTNTGNVGIGTTTPASKLDVNGTARMSGIKITTGAAAGRVLTSDAAGNGTWQTAWATEGATLAGWGRTDEGQINVPSGTFTAVAAGPYYGLAIRSDGTLAAWGTSSYLTPVPSGTFTAVAAGGGHSLAIRSDGTLAGWGGFNNDGEINVPSGTFTAVAAGTSHSLAIRSDGTLAGWGYNGFGEINVPSGTFIAVAAGHRHSLAIRSDGTLAGWGDNTYGQINVPSGTFTAVAGGHQHSVAIRSDGTLAGWGNNFPYGQATAPSGTYTAVAAGEYHNVAIRSDGTLFAWGDATWGATTYPSGMFTAVAAGSRHSLAISRGLSSAFTTSIAADLLVNGSVGIGTTSPSQKLHVVGNICATGTIGACSDGRFKEHVEPVADALEKVSALRGVMFEWKRDQFADHHFAEGRQVGFIAQEVEKVLPEVVAKGSDGYRSIDYGRLTPLLVEAVHEQQKQMETKDKKIADLESRLARLEKLMAITAHAP